MAYKKYDVELSPQQKAEAKVYLVGGGIASLAAAAFLIRDGDVLGHNITIFESMDKLGGSLDGAGTPQDGYLLRGGRMFESKYLCTLDLFASIPTLDGKTTVTEETLAWNTRMPTSSKSRLSLHGHRQIAPSFDLPESDILTIERIVFESESILGRSTIADQFPQSFFNTPFWMMWSTTFAFQPWHSAAEFRRYLVRFTHMVSGFNRLKGIMRTVYNQYDSLVRPLQKWLEERGVVFELGTDVIDLGIREHDGKKIVERIDYERPGHSGDAVIGEVVVRENDYVLVTLGSMTEASSLGGMERAAPLQAKAKNGAWALWGKLASGRPEFGNPHVFDGNIDASKWISFTVTLSDPTFLRLIRDATGNVAGEGGLITFSESNWRLSIVVPYQPHFIGQPNNIHVFWGYGLYVDKPGNFVNKPMTDCTGHDLMTEVLGHLRFEADAEKIIQNAICIPCMMPFITSQFMPRGEGDRPEIVPKHYTNLALMGQYCELPDDVVFTVEYSIRSAQTAVHMLLGTKREPPAVYKSTFNAHVLLTALKALHDRAA